MMSYEEFLMDLKERVYRELDEDDVTEDNFEEMIGLPREDKLNYEVMDKMCNSEMERLLAEFGIQRAIDLYVDEYDVAALCAKSLLYNAIETELHHVTTYEDFENWKQSRTRNE
jgi:hypothetical protein